MENFPLYQALKDTPTLKWKAAQKNELPLWIADMDFPPPQQVVNKLNYYCSNNGLSYGHAEEEASLALRVWMWEQHQTNLKLFHTRWVSGVSQALALCIQSLTRVGDKVVLMTPCYPPFYRIVSQLNRKVVSWNMVDDGKQFSLDFNRLNTILVENNPAMVVINTPHNPTGRVLTIEELSIIQQLLHERETYVVSDEIFQDLVYPGYKHIPLVKAFNDSLLERTVTLVSASKSFNIAGLNAAAIYTSSNRVNQKLAATSSYLLGKPCPLGLVASITAWNECYTWLDKLRLTLGQQRDSLSNLINSSETSLQMYLPQASYLAWIKVSEHTESVSPRDWLFNNTGIDLTEGKDFGSSWENYMRLSFASYDEILTYATREIARLFCSDKDIDLL
ncbi:aminotransferase class I/II-fold pyridoxal phosphate-dependent enzyme [Vibrio mediterranei]|uniref:aminotransferase class I/II-fold pyridoxal phosphate-dependent enzyme n=1 Tax=Vibrio mediterranei TaxID=689 RepID=UPI00148BFCD6|nr:aminotransferase class I/II-fold pyridoxal phosphate-dependent enzyme [Vibrio mediterranei]NOH31504.1 aminotransferase class I/II-fold pyridoxal phosphate-dependent enzyme [Vibrio mediterranei]